MTRISVLGNCQADGMAASIRLLAPGTIVEPLSIVGASPGDPNAASEWRAAFDRSDVVLTQLSDDRHRAFGLPDAPALIASGKVVAPWPRIAFRGFQPDCTYIMRDGVPIGGAVGPYHSAIAAAAFLEQLSERRTLRLFNSLTYAALGYFDEFAGAARVLGQAASAQGYDLSPWLDRPPFCFMHTINHPGIDIIHATAAQALALAGIAARPTDQRPHDRLAAMYAWPVYPEIGSRLGLESSLEFQGDDWRHGRKTSLAGVTAASFDALAADEREYGRLVPDQNHSMANPAIDRARAYIRDQVIGR